jgi:MFS family permease
MNRNVWLLFCCQALMNAVMSGQTVMAALVGHSLAIDKTLNTLPMAIQMTAMMCASIPASMVFTRLGRRPGFWLGCLGSFAGSITYGLGIWYGSFALYCLGAVPAGLGWGIAQHLRFAAAEVAAPDSRPRAISLVMAGGVLAAIIGPELVKRTNMLIPPLTFLGTYAAGHRRHFAFVRPRAGGSACGRRVGANPQHHGPPEFHRRRRMQRGRLRFDEPGDGLDAA